MELIQAFIGALMLLTSPIFGGEKFISWSTSIANSTLSPPPASVEESYVATVINPTPNTVILSIELAPIYIDTPPQPQLSYNLIHAADLEVAPSHTLSIFPQNDAIRSRQQFDQAQSEYLILLSTWCLLFLATVLVSAGYLILVVNFRQLPECSLAMWPLLKRLLAELLRRLQIGRRVKIDDAHGLEMKRLDREYSRVRSRRAAQIAIQEWEIENADREHEAELAFKCLETGVALEALESELEAKKADAIRRVKHLGEDGKALWPYVPRLYQYYLDHEPDHAWILEKYRSSDTDNKVKTREISSLKMKHDDAKAQINRLTDRIEDLGIENRTLSAKIRQHNVNNDALSRKISNLGQVSIDKSISHIIEQNEKQEEIEALSTQLDNTMNKLHSAEDSKKQTQKAIRSRHATIEKLEDSLTEASTGLELAKGEIEDKNVEIKRLEDEVRAQDAKIEGLKGKLSEATQTSKSAEKENKLLQSKVNSHEMNIAILQDRLKKKTQAVEAPEEGGQTKDEYIEDLEKELSDRTIQSDEAEKKLKAQIEALEQQLRAADITPATLPDASSTKGGNKSETGQHGAGTKPSATSTAPSPTTSGEQTPATVELAAVTPSKQNSSKLVNTAENSHNGNSSSTTTTPESGEAPAPVGQAAPKAAAPTTAAPSNKSSTKALDKAENSHDGNETKPSSTEAGNKPSGQGQPALNAVTGHSALTGSHSGSKSVDRKESILTGGGSNTVGSALAKQATVFGQPTLTPITFGKGTVIGQNSTGFNFGAGNVKQQTFSEGSLSSVPSGHYESVANAFKIDPAPATSTESGTGGKHDPSQVTNSVDSTGQHALMASQQAPTDDKIEGDSTVNQSSSATNNTSANVKALATAPPASQGSSTGVTSTRQQGLMASEHAPTPVNNGSGPSVSQSSRAAAPFC